MKLFSAFFILAFYTSAYCQIPTSTTDDNLYPEFCAQAAQNEALFSQFKRHPIYVSVLEHVTFEQGRKYLDEIKRQTPELLDQIDLFKKNDQIGNPKTYFYKETGMISPTTLRYLKIASDLKKQFGNLDHFSIIEIGGGYGGQCKIIADLFHFKKYTIIDLEGPLLLTQRFLHEMNVRNVEFATPDESTFQETFDLVISNYAFSECTFQTQKYYIEHILSHSKRGYLTCNVVPLNRPQGFLYAIKPTILDQLTRYQIPWEEHAENPQTHPCNYLIIWK